MDHFSEASNASLRILLIDDDEFFGRVMQKKAATNGIELEYFSSLEKLGRVAFLLNYDAIILDYWMRDFTGRELAEYVRSFCPDIPVVLISSDKQLLSENTIWPESIVDKICKDKGPTFILNRTFSLVSSSN